MKMQTNLIDKSSHLYKTPLRLYKQLNYIVSACCLFANQAWTTPAVTASDGETMHPLETPFHRTALAAA